MNKNKLTISNTDWDGEYINDNDQYPEFLESVNKYFNLTVTLPSDMVHI